MGGWLEFRCILGNNSITTFYDHPIRAFIRLAVSSVPWFLPLSLEELYYSTAYLALFMIDWILSLSFPIQEVSLEDMAGLASLEPN